MMRNKMIIIAGIVLLANAAKAQDPQVRLEEQELFRIQGEIRQIKPELQRIDNYYRSLLHLEDKQENRLAAAKKEAIQRGKTFNRNMAYYGMPRKEFFDLNRRQVSTGIHLVPNRGAQ